MLLKFLSELLSRGCRVYWSLFRQDCICSQGNAVGKQSLSSILQFHKGAINGKPLFKHVLTFSNAHIRETAFAVAFIRIHSELYLTAVAFNCKVKIYKERHYSQQKCNKKGEKKKNQACSFHGKLFTQDR